MLLHFDVHSRLYLRAQDAHPYIFEQEAIGGDKICKNAANHQNARNGQQSRAKNERLNMPLSFPMEPTVIDSIEISPLKAEQASESSLKKLIIQIPCGN